MPIENGKLHVVRTTKIHTGNVYISEQVRILFSDGFIVQCLNRHAHGDWGDVSEESKALNDGAVVGRGCEALSVYTTQSGLECWVRTDMRAGHTTVILPDEY